MKTVVVLFEQFFLPSLVIGVVVKVCQPKFRRFLPGRTPSKAAQVQPKCGLNHKTKSRSILSILFVDGDVDWIVMTTATSHKG